MCSSIPESAYMYVCTLCKLAVKALSLVRLCIRAGLFESLLLAFAISTKNSCYGPNMYAMSFVRSLLKCIMGLDFYFVLYLNEPFLCMQIVNVLLN